MKQYSIIPSEQRKIYALANDMLNKYSDVNNEEYLTFSSIYAHKLPDRVIRNIKTFQFDETGSGIFLFKNVFDYHRIPLNDTPLSWRHSTYPPTALDFILTLFMAAISNLVSYVEQRPDGGGIVHDVIPIEGDEYIQIGSGSKDELMLHTEDIPLKHACDFLALLVIRNYEKSTSTYCSVSDLDMEDSLKQILFQNRFIFPPDPNFIELHSNLFYNKEKRSVLFGRYEAPYIRFAPFDMIGKTDIDDEAEHALRRLSDLIFERKREITLEAGDLILFNNKRALHGRGSFSPVYNSGNKRWVKRSLGINDLMHCTQYSDGAFI